MSKLSVWGSSFLLEPLLKSKISCFGKMWNVNHSDCSLYLYVVISATVQSMINNLTRTPHRYQDPLPGAHPVPVWGLHVHLRAGVDACPHPQGFSLIHRETGIHSSWTHLCRIYGQWFQLTFYFTLYYFI